MDLDGAWMATPTTEELSRVFSEVDLDDQEWRTVVVPDQWQDLDGFSGDGPILYRKRFEAQPPAHGRRAWLTLEGLFYQSDVWLDGSYLGDTEGYFAPHSFEVTELLRQDPDHCLAIELTCSRPADLTRKTNLTGVFQHWDAIDRDFNPGGIWAPVRLSETGPVRISQLRVLCREANEQRASLAVEASLDAAASETLTIRYHLCAQDGRGDPVELVKEQKVSAGDNRVRARLTVPRPQLWWPKAMGDQPLYRLQVSVEGENGSLSDQRSVTTGLRQVRMRNWVASINGERHFLKGSNMGPTKRSLAAVSPEEAEADVRLALDTGLDLVRLHGHVAHPALYRAADRLGLLIWQDLPLQWGYGNIRKAAVTQAQEAVTLLGHHPSVAFWCGHDEPYQEGLLAPPAEPRRRTRLVRVRTQPLERSIRRALEKADPTRPVISHSGVEPLPIGGTDSHLRLGWEEGDYLSLGPLLRKWPVLGRFIGSFGSASPPADDGFLRTAIRAWPSLDVARLAEHYGYDPAAFEARFPPRRFVSYEDWKAAAQRYQSDLIKHVVETVRRLKYHPTGGFCYGLLADCQPAVSLAVTDHLRTPKPALAALQAACAPVLPIADPLLPQPSAGQPADLAVHVVNDTRAPLEDMALSLRLLDGAVLLTERGWRGAVEADSVALIANFRYLLPALLTWTLRLELELSWTAPDGSRQRVTNSYTQPSPVTHP